MKKIFFYGFALLCLFFQNIYAQTTITNAEYFFDFDPGLNNGIPLPPVDGEMNSQEEIVFSQDMHNLSPGKHILYVRGKDSIGRWGPAQSIAFTVSQTVQSSDHYVSAAEYFFDVDPGEGNGYSLESLDGHFDQVIENISTDIDINHLSIGNHTVFVRGMRDDSAWGPVKGFQFTIDPPSVPAPKDLNVTKAENQEVVLSWRFDTDINGISYNVYRSEMQNGIFYGVNTSKIDLNDVAFGKVIYSDKSVNNGSSYYYKIVPVLNDHESINASSIVAAKPVEIYHFSCNPSNETHQLSYFNHTIEYNFNLNTDENFDGNIYMTCSKLPEHISYEFFENGTNKGASLSTNLRNASITLKLNVRSITPPGEYPFLLSIQNTWTNGSSPFMNIPLIVSVIGQFKQDIFVEIDTNQAFSDSEYQAMDIPVYIQKESDVVIYGAIHSDINQILGTYVHLTIQRDDGKIYIKDVVTDSKGKYRDNSFISTLGMGNYELSASYSSDDSEIYTSNMKRFVIEKGIPTLSCLRSASVEPNLNTDFSITGLLTPASEIPIILRVTRPDNSFNDYTLCVDNEGEYTITSSFFEQQGIWLFKAYWPGDKQFSGCESNLLRVPVSIDFGRAIILAGGMANQQNILWEVTKKLSVNAYRAFRKMGFSNDMICFMINSEIIDIDYDDHADNVVDIDPPTTSIFLEKIEFEYQNDVNQYGWEN